MMNSSKPKISIIIAVYNSASYLNQCLESCIKQTYPEVEVIVIDGGSTDGSVEIIKTYDKNLHYWISESDEGIYDAWNKGLKKASGEWICFIGSDDFLWNKNVLDELYQELLDAKERKIRLLYGKVNIVSEKNLNILSIEGKPWSICKPKIKNYMTFMHCGTFHHIGLFKEYGYFNSSFKLAGDYEFILRELKKTDRDAMFVDNVTVVGMRIGGVSNSLNSRLEAAKETSLARKVNNINNFSKELFFWKLRLRIYEKVRVIFGKSLSNNLANYYKYFKTGKKIWSEGEK
ncbi:glycosyltransferase family 2 protein [Chondrinema litorale]|uniref:glycosyltransferase family 2 protein n=1 Tax=Chondrinema litorale TaxID=2994555 RepID=UPI002543FA88|nr:glycosyltransferase family 2 protein [Chondrinema litorale]UZR94360.1 glycosyltransferase family 2 protein [Chondrinema litorale]